MLITRPWRRLIMPRITARVRRNVPDRLTCSTFSHSSSFMRIEMLSRVMPALFTRMSILPIAASASLARRSMSAASSILAATTWARSPSSDFSLSSASARVPESVTVAPCPCSARAMAPPMPPEAPVTSAAFPVRSNIACLLGGLQERFDVGRRVERQTSHLLVDALDQAGKDLARAALDQLLDLLRLHVLHALAPAHQAGHLLDQPLLDVHGIGDLRGEHVGDQRHARRGKRHLLQRRLHGVGRGLHQRTMEGRTHRQHHAPLAALGLGRLDGALD